MTRWRVQNLNYDFRDIGFRTLEKVDARDLPWRTTSPGWRTNYFATHAEAIAYADKQARRTT